jgi:hypothetical protein
MQQPLYSRSHDVTVSLCVHMGLYVAVAVGAYAGSLYVE